MFSKNVDTLSEVHEYKGISPNQRILDSRYYNIYKISLIVTGFWPRLNPLKKICFLILGSFACGIVGKCQIDFFFFTKNNFDDICSNLVYAGIHIADIMVILNTFAFRERLRKMHDTIDDDWIHADNVKDRAVLLKYAKKQNDTVKFRTGLIIISVCVGSIAPLVPKIVNIIKPSNESQAEIFIVPMNFKVIPNNFYTKYFINVYAAIIAVAIIGAQWNLASLTYYCCCKISLMKTLLDNLKHNIYNTNAKYKFDANISYKIYLCLKLHNEYLEFFYDIVQVFKFIIVVAFFIVVVCLTSTLYMMQLHGSSVTYITKCIPQTTGCLSILYIACNDAEKIKQHNDWLQISCYRTQWYAWHIKLRKNLYMFACKSSIYNDITGLGFISLKLDSFVKAAQASFSYFTIFWSARS